MRCLILILTLAACGEASHLGNPLLLPASGVATAYQNAGYSARREQVKAYLVDHRQMLYAERFQGPHATRLFALGRVPPENRRKVAAELAASNSAPDWAEWATVIVMVHGDT